MAISVFSRNYPLKLVETVGLEPTTLCLQSKCSSHLNYAPIIKIVSNTPMQFPVTPHRPLLHIQKYGSVVTMLPPLPLTDGQDNVTSYPL